MKEDSSNFQKCTKCRNSELGGKLKFRSRCSRSAVSRRRRRNRNALLSHSLSDSLFVWVKLRWLQLREKYLHKYCAICTSALHLVEVQWTRKISWGEKRIRNRFGLDFTLGLKYAKKLWLKIFEVGHSTHFQKELHFIMIPKMFFLLSRFLGAPLPCV